MDNDDRPHFDADGHPRLDHLEAYATGDPDIPETLREAIEDHLLLDCVACMQKLDAISDPRDLVVASWMSDDATVRRRTAAGAPRFDKLHFLARGGLGQVFVAYDRTLARVVALKEIRDDLADDPDARRRFRSEATVTGRLEHPGIIPIYSRGAGADGRPYYAMRLVCGPDGKSKRLADEIREFHEKLRPACRALDDLQRGEFVGLIRRFLVVCQAVDYAHSKEFIHRDLKPENVLVGPFGETVVIDWGISRPLGRDGPEDVSPASGRGAGLSTAVGGRAGTPHYMSPEQAEGKREGHVDQFGGQTDVYGLGGILCAILTGRPPVAGDVVDEVLGKVRRGEVTRPRRIARWVARPLEAVCLKAMALRPADRYVSPRALADDVERWLADEPVAAYREPVGARLARLGRRHKLVVTSAVALMGTALATTTVGLIVVNHEREQKALAYAAEKEQRQQARLAEKRANAQATLAAWDRGRGLCEQGDIPFGLLVFARALELAPPDDIELNDCLRMEIASWRRQCRTVTMLLHESKVVALAVSPDARSVLAGCDDGTATLWELTSPPSRASLDRHQGAVRAVGFSGDARTFITGGADGKARLYDAATRKLTRTLEGHDGEVKAVALSRDGELALTGSADGKARLWQVADGRFLRETSRHPGPLNTVGFAPDAKRFLTGGETDEIHNGKKRGAVWLWHTDTARTAAKPITAFERAVRAAAFSPDGTMLLTGDDDWGVGLFDAFNKNDPIAKWDPTGRVPAVTFAPDGRTALTAAYDSYEANRLDVAKAWEEWQRTKKRIKMGPPPGLSLYHPRPVTAVAIGRDGTFLTACEDGGVRLWSAPVEDPAPRNFVHRQTSTGKKVRAVAFHPDGRMAATGSEDGLVELWNAATGASEGGPSRYQGKIKTLAFTDNGKGLLIGWARGLDFWDLDAKRITVRTRRDAANVPLLTDCTADQIPRARRFKLPEDINAPAFHAKTNRFVTGGEGGPVRLWNATTGEPITDIKEMNTRRTVQSVAFSPDGRRVLACAYQTVQLWDADTGALGAALSHKGEVYDAAFSRDGRWVLTGGDTKSGAQLWNVRYARRVGRAYKHTNDVLGVALSPDGRTALLEGWDGLAALWPLPTSLAGDVERIVLSVQAQVGMKLDESGGRQLLDSRSWQDTRDLLQQPGAPH